MRSKFSRPISVVAFLVFILARKVVSLGTVGLHISHRRLLPKCLSAEPHRSAARFPWLRPHPIKHARRLFAEEDAGSPSVNGPSSADAARAKISDYRFQISRLKQEQNDLQHEHAFLEKAIELKKGQRLVQDGQVKLGEAELADKAKEISLYKVEAPHVIERYKDMENKQNELREKLSTLRQQAEQLASNKDVLKSKVGNLSLDDLLEHQARGLPYAMAGALRKSAAALTPFFDYLVITADTNNRLVDHVSAEIERYAHVNISDSPFLSGVLFYCILLIPLLALVLFVRRISDTSSRLTVSHYIVLGNFYFIAICLIHVLAAQLLSDSPARMFFLKYERPFIVSNVLLAVYYVWHIAMLSLQTALAVERRNVAQLTATVSVGIHYYLFTWRRIFTDTVPLMYTSNYLVYGTIFAFIMNERLARMSKRHIGELALFRFLHAVTLLTERDGQAAKLLTHISHAVSTNWGRMSGAWAGRPSGENERRARRAAVRPRGHEPRSVRWHSPPTACGKDSGGEYGEQRSHGMFSRLGGGGASDSDSSSGHDAATRRRHARRPQGAFWRW